MCPGVAASWSDWPMTELRPCVPSARTYWPSPRIVTKRRSSTVPFSPFVPHLRSPRRFLVMRAFVIACATRRIYPICPTSRCRRSPGVDRSWLPPRRRAAHLRLRSTCAMNFRRCWIPAPSSMLFWTKWNRCEPKRSAKPAASACQSSRLVCELPGRSRFAPNTIPNDIEKSSRIQWVDIAPGIEPRPGRAAQARL